MLFGEQPLPLRNPTATSNAFFSDSKWSFSSQSNQQQGQSEAIFKLKRWDLRLLRVATRWVSSACGSRVQTASERVWCKHEAQKQPLPAQSDAVPEHITPPPLNMHKLSHTNWSKKHKPKWNQSVEIISCHNTNLSLSVAQGQTSFKETIYLN